MSRYIITPLKKSNVFAKAKRKSEARVSAWRASKATHGVGGAAQTSQWNSGDVSCRWLMCDDEAGRGVLSFPTSLLAQLICFLGKLVDDIWVSIWGKAVTVYKKDLGMSHSFSKYHELAWSLVIWILTVNLLRLELDTILSCNQVTNYHKLLSWGLSCGRKPNRALGRSVKGFPSPWQGTVDCWQKYKDATHDQVWVGWVMP